jgi:superfamily II DNA or RNA helicase
MKLRSYQREAVAAVLEQFEAVNSTLVVKPTGTGKTILFAHVIKEIPEKRWMVLAHREELIRQAAAKIAAVTGEKPEIEMAGERADLHMFRRARVVVSSIQTQIASSGGKQRMEKFDPKDFNVIVDEAHHAVSPSYRQCIDYYVKGGAKVLGVTATPDRTDEKALGQVFESVAFVYEINDAIDDGWLVPIHQRYVHVQDLDFSKVRTTAGDLNSKDLAEIMEYEKNLHEVAQPTLELAKWKRTIVFAASVAHAERLAEILNRKRPNCARFVYGETPKDERAQILKDYNAGRFQFLVNVGVFTEGFDEPSIELVVVARPTESRALYAQMIGRGTRPLPGTVDGVEDGIGAWLKNATEKGLDYDARAARREAIRKSKKPHLEVLDFAGNAGRHKLICVADILGGEYDDDVIERAATIAKKERTAVNMAEALERAKAEVHREKEEEKRRQEERRKQIQASASYSVQAIDPFSVFEIEPRKEFGWDTQHKATTKQIELLDRFGIDAKDLSRTRAGQLINECFNRRDQGKCTYKQAKILKKYGYATDLSFADAKATIDLIAGNGWKRPDAAAAAAPSAPTPIKPEWKRPAKPVAAAAADEVDGIPF